MSNNSNQNKMKGKYVILRADKAGVFFGKFEEKNGQEVKLSDVRKLWSWEGANSVEQLALDGTKNPSGCRFTVTVDEMIIDEAIQVIPCTESAIQSIKSVPEWKR